MKCTKRAYTKEAAIRALALIKERRDTGTFTGPVLCQQSVLL